jgi:cyanophycin synthetase
VLRRSTHLHRGQTMKIVEIRTIQGPNVFHDKPILKMKLDIGELERCDSSQLPEFVNRLLAAVPGLWGHRCSKGYPGGFVERLRTGTWMAHIVEHIAIELSSEAGIPVGYGKTRSTDKPGVYEVAIRYENEQGMRELLCTAVEMAEALLQGPDFPLHERILKVRQIVAETELGPSTRAIAEAAESRGIPVRRLNEQSLLQLGYGIHQQKVQATISSNTSHIAVEIAGDKEFTKSLLSQAAIPVPQGRTVKSRQEAVEAALQLGLPVAMKPLDGNHGRGVSLNVNSEQAVAAAFERARDHSSTVLIEQMFEGRDHRIVVVGGKVIAGSERVPAHVVGDGVHSIRELIDIENQNPHRGRGHEKPLTRLCAEESEPMLAQNGWSLESVPEPRTTVWLQQTANISTGGTARDITDVIHPSVRSACERAARVIGLDICGIDLITSDITQPLQDGAGIIEVNAAPGIRMHHHPSEGQPRQVGDAVVEMLFPARSDGRIPIVSITGTNGKTSITRMIASDWSDCGMRVVMTTTDVIWIDGE